MKKNKTGYKRVKEAVPSQAGLLSVYLNIFIPSIAIHRFPTEFSQIPFLYSETMVKLWDA